ncbi:MAG: hypothetical protein J0L79_01075 [Rickettsiales bacterium]|nr:hypothetical protein [Rickettsiales bacterium]MCA0254059.1 hypothetical protein [Pseudomonadota bacterium]
MAKTSSKKKESKQSKKRDKDDVTENVYVGSYNSFEKATHPSALLQAIGPGGSFEFEFTLSVGNKVEQLLGQSDSDTEE